jgi:ATP/maltotriose-dependent transcriptional regulator MalT
MMEHAQRTYQAVAFQIGVAETSAGLGEIQRRRGLLEPALETLQEARRRAHDLQNQKVENRTLLSLGDIYRQQGRIGQAKSVYSDARVCAEELGDAYEIAEAEVHLARLAIFVGMLSDAEGHLAAATHAMKKSQRAGHVAAFASIVQGQLLLTEGDFAQAEMGCVAKTRRGTQRTKLCRSSAVLRWPLRTVLQSTPPASRCLLCLLLAFVLFSACSVLHIPAMFARPSRTKRSPCPV